MPSRWVAGYRIYANPATYRAVLEIFGRAPRGRVLDVAAGEGALTACLADQGFDVVACDLDPSRFQVPGRTCVACDLDRGLPFRDASFDHLACLESIEHLRDPFRLVAECRRVLRPGGRLVISTPNLLNLGSRVKFLLTGFHSLVARPLNEFEPRPLLDHVTPLTYYQLRYILRREGFEERLVTTDRRRRSGWALLWLWPLVAALGRWTMRKEVDPRQLAANREIRRRLRSLDLLLGRTLIVEAELPAGQPAVEAPEAAGRSSPVRLDSGRPGRDAARLSAAGAGAGRAS